MKTIKKIILAIIFACCLFLTFCETETGEQLICTKMGAIALAIMLSYLWQWWGMEKEFKNYLDED